MVTSAAVATRTAAPADVSCSHCDLPVPRALLVEGSKQQFCCSGCRAVYAILQENGLGAYYGHRDAAGASPEKAKTTSETYGYYDDPEFLTLNSRTFDGALRAAELVLEGVHCSACVWLVEKVPTLLPGIVEARLDFGRALLRITWDSSTTPFSKIAKTLDSLGYPPHPRHGIARLDLQRREDRDLLARMGVAGAAAGNAMLLAIALYSGAFAGMDPEYVAFFRWVSVAISVPAVLWSGQVFFRGAFAALRTWTPHMDLPVSIGLVAGTVSGVFNTVFSRGEVYFDSVTTLMFLLLVGRYLQRRQHRAADCTAELIQSLAPSFARLVEDSGGRVVSVSSLRSGDLVEVRAGDRVPVDGAVVEGESSIDESLLTGESEPVAVSPASSVHAGTVNLSSRLLVRVESAGAGTRLAHIVAQVEAAARERPPLVLLADRLAGYFVVVVLALAVGTLLFWLHFDPSRALDTTVALLIVTCPCALGLATPLALSAALSRAARAGALIKGGRAVEGLARRGLIVFDKTGTLTEGCLELVAECGKSNLGPLVAAAERGSAHPIARALVAAFGAANDAVVEGFGEKLGKGVWAVVDGRHVVIGSSALLSERGVDVPAWASGKAVDYAKQAWTPVFVAVDGCVLSVLALGDPLRSNVRESLARLRALGYRIAILSGDRSEVVEATARQVGVGVVDCVAEASPEAKLSHIKRAAERGPVFMVGDGANDAAALSAATVGIAVHGGAEASLAAADVFTTENGVDVVLRLFEGAQRTMRVIHWNLVRSLLYNLLAATLAMSGLLGPLLAAVLMPLSSLTVVASAYRSRTFREASQ